MIHQLRIADRLRRMAATQAEPWHAVGSEILDEANNRVAKADNPSRANYLVALHNNILTICGLLFQECKKHLDRLQMRKEQDADKD